MIRLAARATVSLIADAIALIVGAVVLPDMTLNFTSFLLAVALFAGSGVLIEPLLRQIALKSAPALLGSTALISALIALVVTALLTDGLQIDGFTTWVLATIIVWLVALAARMLLPLVIFKKVLAQQPGNRLA
jgi:putative membrane protein